ncbi:transient receptor potential locus [Escherichia coli]|nr:transient receptor potential locus [Escherichia coli]
MKIGTQNQAFFPENILEKFRYIKEMGFDGLRLTANCWSTISKKSKQQSKKPVYR